jgi:hypothetical protein
MLYTSIKALMAAFVSIAIADGVSNVASRVVTGLLLGGYGPSSINSVGTIVAWASLGVFVMVAVTVWLPALRLIRQLLPAR